MYQSPGDTVTCIITADLFVSTESPGMQRCRLPVDPRGTAHGTAVTVTGRSQRTRIRSGIFDFRSVRLIKIRVMDMVMEPVPLFENNTYVYI